MFARERINIVPPATGRGMAPFLPLAIALLLLLVPFVSTRSAPDYVCGDADGNGIVNVSDAVWLIAYIFGSGPAPNPLESGDCDLNDIVNISDASYLIAFIFGNGPEPCFVPEGSLIGWYGCKSWSKSTPPESATPDQDCLYWEYDGESVLQLIHVNAGANCCPDDIVAEITIESPEITIEEAEVLSTPCYCLCLFDVDYEILGLGPGEYTITILGMYLGSMEPLQVTIDLAANPSGYFCVERTQYPWGP
jgi:hypothetical protein